MKTKILIVVIVLLIIFVAVWYSISTPTTTPTQNNFACTADAMLCPDGSYVGRSGEKCEFVCPPLSTLDAEIQQHINEKSHLIQAESPKPLQVIQSPLQLSGQAVGSWYFEASAPVVLVDWDGRIIAESYITANGDWMTTDFVPFSGELSFDSPYKEGDPDFMKNGSIIFMKDNPSGLPEHDNALEFRIKFAE